MLYETIPGFSSPFGFRYCSSQEFSVSGHVTFRDSSSVSGATLVLAGTTSGAVTDNNGNYTIKKVKPGTYTLTSFPYWL